MDDSLRRDKVHYDGKSWHQECETTGHIESAVRKQKTNKKWIGW